MNGDNPWDRIHAYERDAEVELSTLEPGARFYVASARATDGRRRTLGVFELVEHGPDTSAVRESERAGEQLPLFEDTDGRHVERWAPTTRVVPVPVSS